MFNVYLRWNHNYPLETLQGYPLINIVDFNQEYFERPSVPPELKDFERDFILTVRYTSKIPDLQFRPYIESDPKDLRRKCYVLSFAPDVEVPTVKKSKKKQKEPSTEVPELIRELVISTRDVTHFAIMDYIRPSVPTTSVSDLIRRQELFWKFYRCLLNYRINLTGIIEAPLGSAMKDLAIALKELPTNPSSVYLISVEHGASVTIQSVTAEDRTIVFKITQKTSGCFAATAHVSAYEVPSTVEEIRVDTETN